MTGGGPPHALAREERALLALPFFNQARRHVTGCDPGSFTGQEFRDRLDVLGRSPAHSDG
jgi:hypothetical protein